MTYKEKICEAVEKRYEYWREKEFNSHSTESEIRMSECQHLLLMLNSLQEEPVDEHLNIESMIKSYEQRLLSQVNGVKNSPFVDMCLASYKHGVNETLDTLNLSNLVRIGKNKKEPKFKVGDRIKFKGVRNEDVTRVITNIQKGDEGGFLYLFADGSIYSIDDDGIELVEDSVSEDLEKEIDRAHRIFYDEVGWDSDEGARAYVADWFAHYFANWQKHHMEANRLAHCNSITNDQAELEQKFLDEHLDKYNRMPTFLDAIEYGMRLQKEQLMKGAFEFTRKHNDACVLASECLRDHGWFNREHDFNDLFLYLSCVDELFAGKFSGKTKVIVIKED